MKLKRPVIHRTTLGEMEGVGIPHAGIYVIAYLGEVLYVGKAELGVVERLRQHVYSADSIGSWIRQMEFDWPNVRLDVLALPDDSDRYWLRNAEAALIQRFRPLFNVQLLA